MGALICVLLALFDLHPPRCQRPEPPPDPPPAEQLAWWDAKTATYTVRPPCDDDRWCGCTLWLPGNQVTGYQLDDAPRVELQEPARSVVTCEQLGISSDALKAAEVLRVFGAQP